MFTLLLKHLTISLKKMKTKQKQIDVGFLSVSPLIDHMLRHKIVKVVVDNL